MAPHDRAPYPGLRAFRREETDLFFGRDDCVEAMVERLARTRFLAVLGSSGTGKSSLVRTGLISGLEMGWLPRAGSRWRVVDFRPGGAPLHNLARRLLETENSEAGQVGNSADEVAIKLLRARLKREPMSVIEWCRDGHLPGATNMLLLVDQFEELFRYESYAGREEAEAFVARLLEVRRHADAEKSPAATQIRIYVAITMRSEYLGACALIEGLAEAINEGTFLTPRMTRDECRDAIEGPARICDIRIDEELVNKLLNDLVDFASLDRIFAPDPAGDIAGAVTLDRTVGHDQLSLLARRADQLPLLQHALNRMYEESKGAAGVVNLTLGDYEKIGGLKGALDKHANAILALLESKLGASRAEAVTQSVFRAVTSGTTAADAVRRPTPFGELVSICGGDRNAVQIAVNAFRAEGCNFLSITSTAGAAGTVLDDAAIVDITHESLIRQWVKLREWAQKEFVAAENYRRLETTARLWKNGRAALWTMPDLGTALAWRLEENPNEAWAARYGKDYQLAIAFLDASQDAEKREIERKRVEAEEAAERELLMEREAAARKLAMRTRYAAIALGILAVVAAGFGVFGFNRKGAAEANLGDARKTVNEILDTVATSLRNADGVQSKAIDNILQILNGVINSLEARGGDSVALARSRAEMLYQFAKTYQVVDNRQEALSKATDSVTIRRDLASKNPNEPDLQADYADSLDLVGDIDRASSNYDEALKQYNAALTIRTQVVARYGKDNRWLYGLSQSYVRLGDLSAQNKDVAGALADYEKAYNVDKTLVISDKGSVDWRRELSWSLTKLGDAEMQSGDTAAAQGYYSNGLCVRRHIAQPPNDTNTLYQRDLAFILEKSADAALRAGNLTAAEVADLEALQIRRTLATSDTGNFRWQQELASSLQKSGDLSLQANNPLLALAYFSEAVNIRERIPNQLPGAAHGLAEANKRANDARRRISQDASATITSGSALHALLTEEESRLAPGISEAKDASKGCWDKLLAGFATAATL